MSSLAWDFIAGISVAGILLPEAVAYALIAGVPAAQGIIAALCGLIVYSMLGRSRFAIVTPTSSAAAIVAAAIGSLTLTNPAEKLAAVGALVIVSGGLFAAAGLARLGALSAFISRPVLRGFAFGLAITIIIKQLPVIFGLEGIGGLPFQVLASTFARMPDWNMATVFTGLSGLVLMLVLRQFKNVPAAFIVLVFGIVISSAFDLSGYGVQVVGLIDLETMRPGLPRLDVGEWAQLAELAPPLFLIIFAESWGSIRNFTLRHGDNVEPNRELLALGAANIASGLMQGIPVGAGFSASSANESSGGQSRLAGLFAAIAVLAMMLVARRNIAILPESILAAVVVSALTHALNPQPILRLWKINRDQYVALAATLSVLFLGVLFGMLAAIALSLLALVQRLARPVITVLGQLGDSHDYVDIIRFPEAKRDPDLAIFRPGRPMFFANADNMLEMVSTLSQQTSARAIILSLEESPDFDSTTADALSEFKTRLDQEGRLLFLARVHHHIINLLRSYGDGSLGKPDMMGLSVADTVEMAKARLAGRPPPATPVPATPAAATTSP